MPIKPELRHHYGKAWRDARAAVLARAGNACECRGECASKHGAAPGSRCGAPNGVSIMRVRATPERYLVGGFEHRGTDLMPPVKVVLTVAHLDHNPGTNDLERLRAFCQRCHLRYDRHQHGKSAAETRRRKRTQGQVELWKRS
jgi:hypothetical protein